MNFRGTRRFAYLLDQDKFDTVLFFNSARAVDSNHVKKYVR